MKLNLMFTITAVILVLSGLSSFIIPPSMMGVADVTAAFATKLLGVLEISLGVLAWLVRNAEPSKTRSSIVTSYILLFVLWAAVSVYGMTLIEMPSHTISWAPALIQAVLAIGFVLAKKS